MASLPLLRKFLLGTIIFSFVYIILGGAVLALVLTQFDFCKADWYSGYRTHFDAIFFIRNPLEIFPQDPYVTTFLILDAILSYLFIPAGLGFLTDVLRKGQALGVREAYDRFRKFYLLSRGICPEPNCGAKLEFFEKDGLSYRRCERGHTHSI